MTKKELIEENIQLREVIAGIGNQLDELLGEKEDDEDEEEDDD